ncbi:MAG: hypothetical protein HGA81_09360 [Chlorobium limicola]|nr:hypothetical protein [Chlorobium limicola]
MPEYTFRIKLPKAKNPILLVESAALEWPLGDGLPCLRLSSGSEDIPISKADTLYFTSAGWPNEDAALSAAARYVGALARTLARLRIGVDYGDRASKGGGFSEDMLQMFFDDHGARVINEQPGIMVYESDPKPFFGAVSGSVSSRVSGQHFEAVFKIALKNAQPLSIRERVSIALYNAAYFEKNQDTRFLLGMMALEALIEPADRTPSAIAHVEDMIQQTRSCKTLTKAERDSLSGALICLRKQSIGQAGRTFVMQLKGREYGGLKPEQFFKHCYTLRSRLVHGDLELPPRSEISSAAASLNSMMSDLLSGELRDVKFVPVPD